MFVRNRSAVPQPLELAGSAGKPDTLPAEGVQWKVLFYDAIGLRQGKTQPARKGFSAQRRNPPPNPHLAAACRSNRCREAAATLSAQPRQGAAATAGVGLVDETSTDPFQIGENWSQCPLAAFYAVSCRAGRDLVPQLLLPASRNRLGIFVNRSCPTETKTL